MGERGSTGLPKNKETRLFWQALAKVGGGAGRGEWVGVAGSGGQGERWGRACISVSMRRHHSLEMPCWAGHEHFGRPLSETGFCAPCAWALDPRTRLGADNPHAPERCRETGRLPVLRMLPCVLAGWALP